MLMFFERMYEMMNNVKALGNAILLSAIMGTSVVWGNAAFAAEDTPEFFLDTMVVTATRTPVEAFKANANVSVITGKEIKTRHYQDLSEALRMVPGVYIGNYSMAGYDNSNNLKINGADEIVVLVDGIKVNNVSNRFSAVMLKNMENVERIEVLKGSASTLYGSDAKGGVINIITKKPDKIRTYFRVDGGSNSVTNYYAGQSGSEKDWSWDANVSRNLSGDFKDGNGVTTPSKSKSTSTNFKISKKLSDKHELTATYDSYKADYRYTALWEPALKKGTVDNQNYKFILNSNFDDNIHNILSFINIDNDTNFNNYKTSVTTKRITDQLSAKIGNHLLTGGFEFSHDKVWTFEGKKLINRAFFLQDQFDITKQLKLIAGVRHDNNSGFGKHTTPSANLGYTFNKDRTNVYVSYSEYFIPPTPTQLYSAKYGNPNIKPETGNTKEIGINHKFDDSFVLTAHAFKRYSENRIGYASPHYTNVGDERARGWDVQLKKQFVPQLSAYLGYTHTIVDATKQRARNVDGYVPKGAWNLGVDYDNKDFSASIIGKGIIDRMGPQTADAVDNFFPATTYFVWDAAMNYNVNKNAKIYFKVNNIFDKFYAEHSNARYNWSSDPDGQWWRAPGRSFIVGMEYAF
jgi:vitamin B12 transporter